MLEHEGEWGITEKLTLTSFPCVEHSRSQGSKFSISDTASVSARIFSGREQQHKLTSRAY